MNIGAVVTMIFRVRLNTTYIDNLYLRWKCIWFITMFHFCKGKTFIYLTQITFFPLEIQSHSKNNLSICSIIILNEFLQYFLNSSCHLTWDFHLNNHHHNKASIWGDGINTVRFEPHHMQRLRNYILVGFWRS